MTRGHAGTLVPIGCHRLATAHGDFDAHVFHDLATGHPALAIARGDLGGTGPVLARVHSSCVTGEVFGGCDCDCAEQLDGALGRIAAAERGLVFYLLQEGRGAGFVAKALDRMLVQASGNRLSTFEAYAELGLPADSRRYDAAAAMGRLIGLRGPLVLLSNNPEKIAALGAAGLAIAGTETLAPGVSPFNRHYLAAKHRSGHTVTPGDGALAALPEPVAVVTPEPLDAAPQLVRLASYLLPIRLTPPAWFRVHVYLDTAAGAERVVLTHGARRPPLLHVERDELRERFPLRAPRIARRWRAAAARIVAHGAGVTVFHAARGWDEAAVADPETVAALLAAHTPVDGARFLDGGEADVAAGTEALARRGIRLAAPVVLDA